MVGSADFSSVPYERGTTVLGDHLILALGAVALAVAGPGGVPRDDAARPSADLKPVTVEVVDREDGKPVTEFSYRASYKAPGRVSPEDETWKEARSKSGTVVVQAPPACRLRVEIRSRDVKAGSRSWREVVIRSADADRRVLIKLERGATVHGTVYDAVTKRPVEGARVKPAVLGLRGAAEDERYVTTDREGRYELHGVDPRLGVWASHPDYSHQDFDMDVDKPKELRFDRFLTPCDSLRGTVRARDGTPLEGVTVRDSSGKQARTGRDGTYTIRDATYDLTYRRDGYVEAHLRGPEVTKDGLVVVLEPQLPLEGRVLDPGGRPIAAFAVVAGPGPLPPSWDCSQETVQDREGRFSLGLDRPGPTWVGVRAHGYAVWEDLIDFTRGSKPLTVRLMPGVAVSGKVVMPSGADRDVIATLIPRRDKADEWGLGADRPAQGLATLETKVAGDGSLRFEHVRPDRYTLTLTGPGVTPSSWAVDVPPEGLDLGRLRLAGRGRIEGRVFRSKEHGGGVWSFADGRVRCPGLPGDVEVDFMADEDGRFSVGGIPEGLVKVGFPYAVFDVIHADEWTARVLEGRTTRVHLMDPERSRPLSIEFRIGDGSRAAHRSGTGLGAARKVENVTTREPMIRVGLVPRSREPLTFVDPEWEGLDPKGHVVLSDVGPGAYRLRVLDWLGLRDFDDGVLDERDVTIGDDRTPIKVTLGGGSITGRILGGGVFLHPIEVIAVTPEGRGTSRRTRCDTEGNFCLRYLEPGKYTVFAHEAKAGWLRVEDVAVAADVTDIGEHRPGPGGSILGSISFPAPGPVPDEVIATGPPAVALRLPFEVYSSFDQFELRGLWPGAWTVQVRSGGQVLARANAEVTGTARTRVSLVVREAEAGPVP
jgi:hypothetical protein